jgi:hypothetical protein
MTGFLIFLLSCLTTPVKTNSEIRLAEGEQPQLAVDGAGVTRMIFGREGRIYYSQYNISGNSFPDPIEIASVPAMHLGMSRGPQLASSKNFSMVVAIDEAGNIHSFRLNHKNGQWSKIAMVNDVEGSAKEGLLGISADADDHFYAVWLDLRNDHHNKITFSSTGKDGKWNKNRIIYSSPDGHVCECCKPSVAVKDNSVSLMFRNWIAGSRDLYIMNSTDGGKTFGQAQKLGKGTWKLKGCPMDGGGIVIDSDKNIHTLWQRDGNVFYSEPGMDEVFVANGRSCTISGKSDILMGWQSGSDLHIKSLNGKTFELGEGTALRMVQPDANTILATWEREKQIYFRRLTQ